MITIDLDRRFVEWNKGDEADPELLARFRITDRSLGWSDLLKRLRVVVLAEGGSGKSAEFARQAKTQSDTGKDAWYLTVQAIAENGIEDSLTPASQAHYLGWRASDRHGWLFVDSVDEAKLNHIRFEKALRRLAAGIAGAEGRAHVIISGRHTDWESVRDLRQLNEELPIPEIRMRPEAPTGDELLVSIVRRERPEEKEEPKESALVAVMLPLDVARVRRFAEGKGVSGVQDFLEKIESADLWQFARRPLDLGWLLDYWRRHGSLGSLAKMLHTSLTERLKEADAQRDRQSSLDETRAMRALERIGAAMVFGRTATIAIPDTDLDLGGPQDSLNLPDVLPDYMGPERADLLNRAVFDPATFARTRLHNDNLGVVRSYLAARWLLRLRGANLPARRMFALLFGESYGVKVVIPSTRETAAWLALWDRDVAREVAQREPWVLLTGGDPGSLPPETRRAVLTELARRMVAENHLLPTLDPDSLKRFASADLSDTVRELWVSHRGHAELRWLLLRLILFGRLTSCTDLVSAVALDERSDRRDQALAGRALVAIADDGTKRRYGAFIVTHLADLPKGVIWNAVEGLFPTYIGIDDLLTITGTIDIADSGDALGFEWQGPELVERLVSKTDIEHLLRGLMDQWGGQVGNIGQQTEARDDVYGPAIGALACQLLKHARAEEAPSFAIEAALRLGQNRRSSMTPWKAVRELPGLLLQNSARRRLVFWEAAQRLSDHRAFGEGSLDSPYQMQILGWSPQLSSEDIDWLLIDGPQRERASERRLAVNAALEVAQKADAKAALLSRIEGVASGESEMRAAFLATTAPPAPSAEQQSHEAELREHLNRNEIAQAELSRGWLEFVTGLRRDPDQLRKLLSTTESTADSRLVRLWQLLDSAGHGKNRFAIETLDAVEPILGAQVSAALRDVLVGFWRTWRPHLASSRQDPERNQINTFDCMGITGLTLEAKADPRWAARLDSAEASRAACYATLELNGLPDWLSQLALVHPSETAAVLDHEIGVEIAEDAVATHYKTLQSLSNAELPLKQLMAAPLLKQLTQRNAIPEPALAFILGILSESIPTNLRHAFLNLVVDRAALGDVPEEALYLGAAFAVDSDAAAEALSSKLDKLPEDEQTELVERVLPLLFGDRALTSGPNPKALSFACLVRIVRIAYSTVRVGEDRQRPSGVAYSPDQHDRAQWARNAAFKALIDTPGRATFEALLAFREVTDFPISRDRLLSMAIDRAAADAESDPWPPGEAKGFEELHEAVPKTPLDLQRLALFRLADIQDDLLNSDFEQGSTLKGQPNETAVQKWVGDRFDMLKGSSYTVERESRVVDEKEPDVRLRSKQSHATVAMEIKVAESWSLAELEAALTTQLCGKYLRAKDARHGILLLVHQKSRPKGWKIESSGLFLSFAQVIARLKGMAAKIAARDPDSPQAEIAVLDVSCVATTS
jgi:hypothetical protein